MCMYPPEILSVRDCWKKMHKLSCELRKVALKGYILLRNYYGASDLCDNGKGPLIN